MSKAKLVPYSTALQNVYGAVNEPPVNYRKYVCNTEKETTCKIITARQILRGAIKELLDTSVWPE